ncbi:hypothetical protein ACIRP2_28885 [Streptomyces sp. NPDC101194]|uniref:RHS repeat domain-containing protein n=1 Tax=Streptomyces sp. NPDC101194 TaxID=3366127 RepID=UPI00380C7DBB
MQVRHRRIVTPPGRAVNRSHGSGGAGSASGVSPNRSRPPTRRRKRRRHVAHPWHANLRMTGVINPQGLEWHYEYDPAGRLISESGFDGRTVMHTYDAANRMTSRTNSLGPAGSLNVDPRDVFPMTHHVECVAILEPADKGA